MSGGLFSAAADLLDPPAQNGGWRSQARPEQLAPLGDWYLWFILAGRGWGKTRTGAEWLLENMRAFPGSRWGMVAPTWDDGRDIMVEGDSGLLTCALESDGAKWNSSLGHFSLKNGSMAELFTAEKPDRARGPNLRGMWGDEPASWRYGQQIWDIIQFAIRKGDTRICMTGTPKPTPFVRMLMAEADIITRGSSYDNLANLSDKFRTKIIAKYEGTRLGRQELNAEILEDIEGALWTLAQIEASRLDYPRSFEMIDQVEYESVDLSRIVVAIDPAAESTSSSDETGIVVVGSQDNHGWVLDDLSGKMAPEVWARRAVDAFEAWDADEIVAEVNNGGDMVRAVIHAVNPKIPVRKVRASRGKRTRAEPISLLYQQQIPRVHHARVFPELEDQLTTWVPDSGQSSPDRLDAMVWGLTRCLLAEKKRRMRFQEAA